MQTEKEITVEHDTKKEIKTVANFKEVLVKNYKAQLEAQLKDPETAKAFMANAIAIIQQNPKLLNCTPHTVFNGLMIMASLKLMPSAISGEAYLIPYKNKGVDEAQFQLGYQGLVTLFYRAGVRSIASEIVYKKDKFSFINGVVEHSPDIFAEDRGDAIGAYVAVELQAGGRIYKAMSAKEILAIGQKFSKSFSSEYSPWNVKNDPQRWQWKKTVLKQEAKLIPKNETIYKAVEADNADSIISDRIKIARTESAGLSMGNFELPPADTTEVIIDDAA